MPGLRALHTPTPHGSSRLCCATASAGAAKRSLALWVETTRPAKKMALSCLADKDRDTLKRAPGAKPEDLNDTLEMEIAFFALHLLLI